jgi:quinone-modifying oxidoreductase subunit QmoC
MASLRAMMVEKLAFPAFMGSLVGNVKKTWPLLVFGPILFWMLLLGVATQFQMGEVHHGLIPGPTMGQFFYDQYVPHILIYSVYFTAVGLVCLALFTSGMKLWKLMGDKQKRSGNFIGALIGAFIAIALHNKFSSCDRGVVKRRWGHFLVMWGFVGAAVTSGFAVVYLYRDTVFFSWLNLEYAYPVPISHWVKLLGNFSAIILVIGGIMLFINRLSTGDKLVGVTTAFDRFFLWVVLAVIGTGVLTEIFRFVAVDPMIGFSVYIVHLGVVLCLFLTLPYSKFAHILYRTLAMTHERMTAGK